MDLFGTYGKEVVALIVPFLTWFLNVGLKARAKLIWASPHAFSFLIQEPIRDKEGVVLQQTQRVCTASIRIINTGRDTATKVELVFNWKPQYINLWPVRYYECKTDSDNRHILIFDNLAPKEEIGLEVMSINVDLPGLLQVRSAECVASNLHLSWGPYYSPWKFKVAGVLMLAGLGAVVYIFINLVQFLVLRTPIIN